MASLRRLAAACALVAVLAGASVGASGCSMLRAPATASEAGGITPTQRAALAVAEQAERVSTGLEDLQAVEIAIYRSGAYGPEAHLVVQREFLAVAEALRPALADLLDVGRAVADQAAWLRFAQKQIDRLATSDALESIPVGVRGEIRAIVVGMQSAIAVALAVIGG